MDQLVPFSTCSGREPFRISGTGIYRLDTLPISSVKALKRWTISLNRDQRQTNKPDWHCLLHNSYPMNTTWNSTVTRSTPAQFHYQVTTSGKLFKHLLLSPSSVNWYWSKGIAVMSYDWEGNRRPGVELAMRHRQVVYPPTSSMASGKEKTTPTTLCKQLGQLNHFWLWTA